MTLTRAVIDDDPTVARWDLARIGTADGSIEPVIQGVDPWIEFLPRRTPRGQLRLRLVPGLLHHQRRHHRITDVAYRLETAPRGCGSRPSASWPRLDEITDFDVLPAGLALKDAAGHDPPRADPRHRPRPAHLDTRRDLDDASGDPCSVRCDLNTSAVRFKATAWPRVAPSAATSRPTACAPDWRSAHPTSSSTGRLPVPSPPRPRPARRRYRSVENAFIDALEAASSHALRGSELELKDVNGNTLMRLLPQADLVGPDVGRRLDGRHTQQGQVHQAQPPKGERRSRRHSRTSKSSSARLAPPTAAAANLYVANYRTPAAAKIRIWDATVDGRACNGTKARSAACKQQRRFLNLLQSADSYTVRETEHAPAQGQPAPHQLRPRSRRHRVGGTSPTRPTGSRSARRRRGGCAA